jgi:hypothetical protein
MGLLFLIADYFVPDSLDRKGSGKVPQGQNAPAGHFHFIYMLFINPAINNFASGNL